MFEIDLRRQRGISILLSETKVLDKAADSQKRGAEGIEIHMFVRAIQFKHAPCRAIKWLHLNYRLRSGQDHEDFS